MLSPEYLIPYRGDEDRHEGGQDVEETIREIFQCGDLEDRSLRHAARVPRNKHRSDRSRIFYRTAQQTVFVSFPLVELPVEAAVPTVAPTSVTAR